MSEFFAKARNPGRSAFGSGSAHAPFGQQLPDNRANLFRRELSVEGDNLADLADEVLAAVLEVRVADAPTDCRSEPSIPVAAARKERPTDWPNLG